MYAKPTGTTAGREVGHIFFPARDMSLHAEISQHQPQLRCDFRAVPVPDGVLQRWLLVVGTTAGRAGFP